MTKNITLDPHNLQEICRVETIIDKIQASIKLFRLGVYPIEIFAIKIEEFSNRLNEEVANG